MATEIAIKHSQSGMMKTGVLRLQLGPMSFLDHSYRFSEAKLGLVCCIGS